MATLLDTKLSCADNLQLLSNNNLFRGVPYLDSRATCSAPNVSSYFEGLCLESVPEVRRSSSRDTSGSPSMGWGPRSGGFSGVGGAITASESTVGTPVFDRIVDSKPNIAEPCVNKESGVENTVGESKPHCVDLKVDSPHVFTKWMHSWARKTDKESEDSDYSVCRGTQITDACTIDSTITSLRGSFESSRSFVLSPDTVERMQERMNVVEELISTEEYYVQDLKALRDQCIPVLCGRNAVPVDVVQSLEHNIRDMIHLHDRLLAKISQALPSASKRIKGRSLDINFRITDLSKVPVLALPHAAGEVAIVFDDLIAGFFEYEDYSAQYALVSDTLKKRWYGMPSEHRKGSEVLVGTTRSSDNRQEYGKRAMELDDMLVKPIQRICKYPLLFGEILKHTPAIDCPESNRLLERVRKRLDEVVERVNESTRRASDNRQGLEKTWLLQNRLVFQGKSEFPTRLLGHSVLCGALHIIWQTNDAVAGSYMACMLFDSHLILATVMDSGCYQVQFCITLAAARIEETDRGKGLHAPSAPHSWKIVFESGHRLYEVLATSSSMEEEIVWRDAIERHIFSESIDYDQYTHNNLEIDVIFPDMRPIGEVHGRLGSFARRQSLYGALATSLLDPDMTYVVVNDTYRTPDFRDSSSSSSSLASESSTLAFSHGEVPTFNMKRADRNAVVSKLVDVWSKDLLPVEDALNGTQKTSRLSKVLKGKGSFKTIRRNISASDLSLPLEDSNDRQTINPSIRRLSWAAPFTRSPNKGLWPGTRSATSLSSAFISTAVPRGQDRADQSPCMASSFRRRRPVSTVTNRFSLGSSVLKDALPEQHASTESKRLSDPSYAVEGSSTPVSVTDSIFSTAVTSTPASSIRGDCTSVTEEPVADEPVDNDPQKEKIYQRRPLSGVLKHNMSFRGVHKRKNSNTPTIPRTSLNSAPVFLVQNSVNRLSSRM